MNIAKMMLENKRLREAATLDAQKEAFKTLILGEMLKQAKKGEVAFDFRLPADQKGADLAFRNDKDGRDAFNQVMREVRTETGLTTVVKRYEPDDEEFGSVSFKATPEPEPEGLAP